jgi:polar amino acid transport system permease protein
LSDKGSIQAVPLRHYKRWAVALLLLLALAGIAVDAASREAYEWSAYWKYLFDGRVIKASIVTLELTLLSMLFAIILGVALGVMRRTDNPIFKNFAWLFIWIFRGTPVYVQLVFWGLFSTIYKEIFIGIPWVAIGDFQFGVHFTLSQTASLFWIAVLGLTLNEAAYMAEIVRGGLLAVDSGQEEAAKSIGMSNWQTMRHIVIPQAMRVIIPPTGNEVISMLKTTSLVTAVPLVTDLYARTRDIANETYNPIPLLLVACSWYLFYTTILMIAQYFLEKRFGRGFNRNAVISA